MLKNDLLTPYLLKEKSEGDETCKDITFNNHWEANFFICLHLALILLS